MSLVFWAFHDGGEGVGKLIHGSSHHHHHAKSSTSTTTGRITAADSEHGGGTVAAASGRSGGGGSGAADQPLYVDDREANDVLAVYRVMLSSTFCVHIGGDTPTRKSFVDAILVRPPCKSYASS